MAFTLATFVPLSGMANSGVPRVFLYSSADLIAAINTADYFLDQYLVLNAGDKILVYADNDGNPSYHELIVTAATSATVTTLISTSQELIASGAVNSGVQSVELAHATVAIAATIADSKAHQGLFVAKATLEPGAGQDHTLTLTAGTFDGSNNVATFADILDTLVVWFDSAGKGTIVENVGSVGLS